MDPAVGAVLRGGLALVLAAAAVHKARGLDAFRETLRDYQLAPRRLVSAAAVVIVALEGVAVLALVFPRPRALGPLLATALLAVYTAAIAVNLARGRRHIDCGCGGPAGQPIGSRLVVRNAVLGVAALACVAPPGTRPLVWIDALTAVAGTLAVAALYAAAGRLMANAGRLPERA
jgi:hypothetical protein